MDDVEDTETTEGASLTETGAPDRDDGAETPDAGSRVRPASGLRSLDARTIAISVCIALVAAIGVALALTALTGGGDDGSDAQTSPTIQLTEQVDRDALLDTGLLTIEGEPTTLRERLGDRPVVVNLWAQSCAPCIKEMPLLEQASLDNPTVDFLGVDTQDRLDKAKVMAERTGITYPWVQDPMGDFFVAAQGAGMPTTFIIMPSGEIVASKTGPFASQDELQGWLDRSIA